MNQAHIILPEGFVWCEITQSNPRIGHDAEMVMMEEGEEDGQAGKAEGSKEVAGK